MTATFQYGQILQGQQKFDEAIAAWKGYLAKFPNGPQSADAQRAILDTQLLIAADHLAAGAIAEARAAWSEFVAQNPLDPRVPRSSSRSARASWPRRSSTRPSPPGGRCSTKFPGSEPAAHAQFLTASIFETEKGDPAAAIERFKQDHRRALAVPGPAADRGDGGEGPDGRSPRGPSGPGEAPALKITTRNLEKLTFTAYKLNAEAYFRKKHGLENVESLDIGLVAPDAEWTVDVPGYARYKPVETTYELKKLELPGVYVVKVTDEKYLQATTLVLGSDLDAIVKTSRDQVLVFAQDMKTGKGRPRARVLVSDAGPGRPRGGDRRRRRPAPRLVAGRGRPIAALTYLVLDGAHVAGSGLGVPDKVAQGLTPRAYIYTDRPAYRPGPAGRRPGRDPRGPGRPVCQRPQGEPIGSRSTDSRGRQIVARRRDALGVRHVP